MLRTTGQEAVAEQHEAQAGEELGTGGGTLAWKAGDLESTC